MFDESIWKGTEYKITPPDWDKVFDHIESLISCRSCRGKADYQYFKEVVINHGWFSIKDYAHDYYLCERCAKAMDDGVLKLMPRGYER